MPFIRKEDGTVELVLVGEEPPKDLDEPVLRGEETGEGRFAVTAPSHK